MRDLQWSNPKGIDTSQPFIYLIEIIDDKGNLLRYAGKARNKSRLNEYVRNINKIFNGIPRGKTQKYRAVHLALAKACEAGWQYKIHPIESSTKEMLNIREKHLIKEYQCNLNGGKTWHISNYSSLSVEMLISVQ